MTANLKPKCRVVHQECVRRVLVVPRPYPKGTLARCGIMPLAVYDYYATGLSKQQALAAAKNQCEMWNKEARP